MDSGTTYILGPKEQVESLFADLCDRWPRCRNNFTEMENATKNVESQILKTYKVMNWDFLPIIKVNVFLALLNDCNAWFEQGAGLNELPSIHLHFKGSGNNLTMDLDPWTFIVSRNTKEMRYHFEDILGFGNVAVNYTETGRNTWTCTPAFGIMNYETDKNGPAWIFGMPIFYAYVVHHDLGTVPPSMSFTKEPCGNCNNSNDDAPKERLQRQRSLAYSPRKLQGEPRSPSFTMHPRI